jgi:hypothetical protein
MFQCSLEASSLNQSFAPPSISTTLIKIYQINYQLNMADATSTTIGTQYRRARETTRAAVSSGLQPAGKPTLSIGCDLLAECNLAKVPLWYSTCDFLAEV